jgi:leucyl aminopeptidase (aminopeptidase T)
MTVGLCGVLLAGLLPWLVAKDPPPKDKGREEPLAEKLVNLSARVHEGDLVRISGTVNDTALLEALAVQVRKQGAHPLVTLDSGKLTRRLFDDVPARFDDQTPAFELKLAELVNATITIDSGDFDQALAGVPVERTTAARKAYEPIATALLKRSVRQVSLGNNLFPTAYRAKQLGVSEEQLAKVFWEGVDVDPGVMERTGGDLRKTLSAGKDVHLTNDNGTDLKASIKGRKAFVSDGIITAEKEKEGGPACQVWLPAGEAYVTMVPGSAEGRVVFDRYFFQDKEVIGLALTIKAGKIVKMEAKSGLEPLQAAYDAAGEGKDRFGYIDVGFNPNVKLIPDSKMVAWMPAGMVSVGAGGDQWAGGDNNLQFGIAGHLPGSTLTVDGKAVVEKGVLKR